MTIPSYYPLYRSIISRLLASRVSVSVASPNVYMYGFPLAILSELEKYTTPLMVHRARLVLYPNEVLIAFPDVLVSIILLDKPEIRLYSRATVALAKTLSAALVALERYIANRGSMTDLVEVYKTIRELHSKVLPSGYLILDPELPKLVYKIYSDTSYVNILGKLGQRLRALAEEILRVLDLYSDILPNILRYIYRLTHGHARTRVKRGVTEKTEATVKS